MALEYLAEVMDECANVHCQYLLIDRDIPAAMSDADMTATMKKLVRMSKGIRIAFVNKHADLHEALRTGVEGSVPGADFKYFTSVDEAEVWLLSSPPTPLPMPDDIY
jgi:hypothetical protein